MVWASSELLLLPVVVVRARCLLLLAPPCSIGRLPAARELIAITVLCAVFAAALAFAAAAAECATAVLAPYIAKTSAKRMLCDPALSTRACGCSSSVPSPSAPGH